MADAMQTAICSCPNLRCNRLSSEQVFVATGSKAMPLSNLLKSAAGTCPFCNQKAGILSREHSHL